MGDFENPHGGDFNFTEAKWKRATASHNSTNGPVNLALYAEHVVPRHNFSSSQELQIAKVLRVNVADLFPKEPPPTEALVKPSGLEEQVILAIEVRKRSRENAGVSSYIRGEITGER